MLGLAKLSLQEYVAVNKTKSAKSMLGLTKLGICKRMLCFVAGMQRSQQPVTVLDLNVFV